MRPVKRQAPLSELDTHKLWVAVFKQRQLIHIMLLKGESYNAVMGEVSLLGLQLNELRSRGLQGKLDA